MCSDDESVVSRKDASSIKSSSSDIRGGLDSEHIFFDVRMMLTAGL